MLEDYEKVSVNKQVSAISKSTKNTDPNTIAIDLSSLTHETFDVSKIRILIYTLDLSNTDRQYRHILYTRIVSFRDHEIFLKK